MTANTPIRIANCSGFYGDRVAAAREMVEGGPIDALTGDWLAELTMLILAKNRAKDVNTGYARTFVTQMEQVMGTCLDKGIKVVTNAGGLNPAGCAEAVHTVASKLGLNPTIAYVAGDDLLDRLGDLQAAGHDLANLDTGAPYGARKAMTANAYLGCWGAVEALNRGADIVITGRTTDAAVVMAPAAWKFGWTRTDWDALAGACVAGHVIECGCQCTGGNYSFFTEIPRMIHPGFPIAEIYPDGSSVITKHEGTDGAVTVGTVTAQLLYEIGGPRYFNPDVVARFDTIRLAQEGPDRVRISDVRGEPAPETLKVCINYEGGYRNSMNFLLTGLDIEAKAALVEAQLWAHLPGGKDAFREVTRQFWRLDKTDPDTNEEAVASLTITVKDDDARKVGRAFASPAVELGLASYPGYFGSGGPREAEAYGVYWPTLVPGDLVHHEVVVGGDRTVVDSTPGGLPGAAVEPTAVNLPAVPDGPTVRAPLGRIIGARSGDKGGNANAGLFARSAAAYAWLASFLTADKIRELYPEAAAHRIDRYEFPNLWSLNIVFHGLLEDGVAAATRQDRQAKGLGEYLRSRVVDIPASLLG
ncbi:MAG: acyclic terpene utilization AtuA family protein [Acidimicrobiales bacterium]